jgi:iron uptake system component EfeO
VHLRPAALSVVLAAAVLLTGCGADEGTAPDGAAIAVTASDDTCAVDVAEVAAGPVEVTVTNDGSTVTEVYVYAADDRIVGEVEDVTPGLTRSFAVTVEAGSHEIACKPGQTGDGIRTPLTVTAASDGGAG